MSFGTYDKEYIDEELEKRLIQVSTMPTASAELVGKIYEYVGTTTTNYKNGYFYKCVLDGTTYKWENVKVQDGDVVLVDDETIDKNGDGELEVKDGGVGLEKLANQGAVNVDKVLKVDSTGNFVLDGKVYDTGTIGEFKTAPFLMDNFVAFDGTTNYEKNGIHKELYDTYSANCPSLLLAGSDSNHFKLRDLTGRYVKLDKNGNGSLGSESLPNIQGSLGLHGAENGSFFAGNSGALGYTSLIGYYKYANYQGGASSGQGITFNAHSSNSVYQDGAKVNPDNITMIPQARYKMDKVASEGKQDIFDSLRPIHSTFTQYGANDNPNTLFNGNGISSTWTKVTLSQSYIQLDSTATAGTAVAEQLPDHFHRMRACYGTQGDAYSFAYTHPKASAWTEDVADTGWISDYGGPGNPNGVYVKNGKIHPAGQTAILWERTA